MLKIRNLFVAVFSAFSLLFFTTPVLAGGGPVEFTVEPNASLNPGEQYVVHARVYADGPYPAYCKDCLINLAFENPQDSDYIAQSSDKTDSDGRIYAKVISKIPGKRTLILKDRVIKDASGKVVTANSYVILNYNGDIATPTPTPVYSYAAPTMVYPQDGQTLDFEGSYNFKVNQVPGATGYLFGFFRDGKAFFENYATLRTLSPNGEFAVTENTPGRDKFQPGNVQVWVRALINNQWTDARIITVTLKSRNNGGNFQTPAPLSKPAVLVSKVSDTGVSNNILITPPSASSGAKTEELNQKIENLQKQLQESQKRQANLEQTVNNLVKWIRSVFPFFK